MSRQPNLSILMRIQTGEKHGPRRTADGVGHKRPIAIGTDAKAIPSLGYAVDRLDARRQESSARLRFSGDEPLKSPMSHRGAFRVRFATRRWSAAA